MTTICDYLVIDHKRCDRHFTDTQERIARQEWPLARRCFDEFHAALGRHIAMEEKILFPAFMSSFRHCDGPLAILRAEHARIRTIVERMAESVARQEAADFFLHAESLTLLMHDHHEKEEDMLYPLLDKALQEGRDAVIAEMSAWIEQGNAASPH